MQTIDLKRAHEFTTELWQFYRRNALASPDDTNDEYWKRVASEARAISDKYGRHTLRIILDVIDLLEELASRNSNRKA